MSLSVCQTTPEEKVEMFGVLMPKLNGTMMVPKVKSNYIFPEITFDILLDVMESRPLILTGHTGTGKSSLIEQIAAALNQDLVRVNLNDQMTIEDFIGTNTLVNKETVWVDGFLIKAMKEGWWITLEELDFAPPEILVYLNTILEKDSYLVLKEKGFEVIKPHANFRVFATANTIGCMSRYSSLYQGARRMNDAFLDRFRIYHVAYLSEENETKLVADLLRNERSKKRTDAPTPEFETKVLEMANSYVKVANAIRASFENEGVSATFSTRRLLDWVEASTRHKNVMKGAELALYSKINSEDAKVIKRTIESIFNPIYTQKSK